MEKASDIAVVVLGAGTGKRFANDDKLDQKLGDKAVAHHIMGSLAPFRWGRKILVHRGNAPWHDAFIDNGYILTPVVEQSDGMLGSMHNGLAHVTHERYVLVCLADMPLVSIGHLASLLGLFRSRNGAIVASRSRNYRGPPAIIPLARLDSLPKTGEAGARILLDEAQFVDANELLLADIDTSDDLEKVRICYKQAGPASFLNERDFG